MRFPKRCFFVLEFYTITSALLVLSILLYFERNWMMIFVPVFLLMAIAFPRFENEHIVISENGIACEKSGRTIWFFPWEEIDSLQKTQRYRSKAVDIICKNPTYQSVDYYFQLGWKAKKALQKYQKCPMDTNSAK